MSNLNNWLAFLGFLVVVVAGCDTIKNPKKILFNIFSILIGVAVLILSIVKNNKDDTTAQNNQTQIDSLDKKADITNAYLRKIDSMGIKRDSATNTPRVTKKFINYIQNLGTLNEY